MELNKAQLAAVDHFCGPLLVLSGPGSGKTTVIVNRIINLISKYHVNPENILVVTFTKSAAEDMKRRFTEKCDISDNRSVTFGTLHSVFFSLLRNVYGFTSGNIIREKDKGRIMREVIRDIKKYAPGDIDFDITSENIALLISGISKKKEDASYVSEHFDGYIFEKIFEEYTGRLRKYKKLDFDDMMLYTKQLLLRDKGILEKVRNRYQFILIDEYQDINEMQYDILRILSHPHNNIFAVGDDDQAIYGFRGAKPDIMKKFANDYRDAKIIRLDMNYRCNEDIVELSSRLISNNKNRFQKKSISSGNKSLNGGVEVCECENASKQCEFIMKKHRELIANGIDEEKVAVLFRTNNNPMQLCRMLSDNGIEFQTKDKVEDIFEHRIIKDLLTYVLIAAGRKDRMLYLKVIALSYPDVPRELFENENIDKENVENKAEYMVNNKLMSAWEYGECKRFLKDVKFISNLNTYGIISYVRYGMGYEKHIKEYEKHSLRNADGSESIRDMLNIVEEASKRYSSPNAFLGYVEKCRDKLREQTEEKNKKGMVLSTIHSSKGLEFDVVFIIDANEQIIPHNRAESVADMEEERRLFYVAMTRASKKLYILYTKERYGKCLPKSRFIKEIGR